MEVFYEKWVDRLLNVDVDDDLLFPISIEDNGVNYIPSVDGYVTITLDCNYQ